MFVSFSVGNTGPFKEVTGITTVCESLKKEFLEKNTFEVGGHNYNKISYIYGANGSGKTNFLSALTKMQKMIIMSVMKRGQAVQLRNFVKRYQLGAFIAIVNSSEIIGKGFRGLN